MIEMALLISAGLLVGFLVGLTGVGGGALMTPILILGFNIPPVIAIATDLLFASITKLSTIPLHNSQGSVDWKTARMVWAGSIPGVVIGIVIVIFVLQEFFSFLGIVLALVLLLTSASMFISINLTLTSNLARPVSILAGGFIGISVATTSVGAGALGMAIFRSLSLGKQSKDLVGTDIVHAIPITLIAGIAYFSEGLADLQLLSFLLLGSVPGALLGSKMSSIIGGGKLKKILGIALFGSAIGILAKSIS